jgi:outer membrane receptor for ferrienterochelin and colicins
MRKWSVVIALIALLSGSATGQLRVVDADTGEELPGVTVRVQTSDGQTRHLSSAVDGGVELPKDFKGILRFSAVGYKTFTDTINGQLPGRIDLKAATFAIAPAVVTGQFDPVSRRDAVQRISVISKVDIERIGAVTLRDVLRTQSTLNIGQDSQLGTQTSMLGLSGRHIQVLIDGVPVIGRLDGNIDMDQLPLDNVVRIEVIEGPMSVEFGSEAVAGTINLITQDGRPEKAVSVRAMAETAGRYTTGFNVRLPGEKWRFQATGSRLLFNGYSPEGGSRSLLWKPKEQLNGQLSLGRQFGDLSVRLSSFLLHETLWNEGAVQYSTYTEQINDTTLAVFERPFARDEVFVTQRMNVRADIDGKVSERSSIQGFVAYDRFTRQSENVIKDLTSLAEQPVGDVEANDTSVFVSLQSRLSYRHAISERLKVSLGYDVKTEEALGKRIDDRIRTISDVAVFATAEYALTENLDVRPGLRVIENSAYEAPLIPSLHLRWSPRNGVFRASYGRGFRAPELKELYFLFVDSNHNIRGNDLLEAEVSDSYQVSYEHSFMRNNMLVQPSVTLFYNDVENLIDLALVDQETQLYEYTNLGNVQSQGVNATLSVKSERWMAEAQSSLTFAENRLSNSFLIENRIWQGALSAEYRFPKTRTAVNVQSNLFGNQPQTTVNEEGEVEQFELAPYTMLGVFAHQSLFKQRLRLSVGCENLLDVDFRNTTGVAGGGAHTSGATQLPVAMGRLFRFTLQYDFLK